jgi:ribosome-associated protein
MDLLVSPRVIVPDSELQMSFARSSGPGGQNVNKVESKAILRWNVRTTECLPADVRERFLAKYNSRLTKDGDLLLASQEFRDQPRNIEACRERLVAMIRVVLQAPKKRRATKPTKGSKVRRLNDKKSRSQVKQGRQYRGE